MTKLLRRSRGGGGGASSSSGGEARRGVRVHLKEFTAAINIGDCNGEGTDYNDN